MPRSHLAHIWGMLLHYKLGLLLRQASSCSNWHNVCMQNVRAVAAGGAHTSAVTERSVYSWGSNSAGQLGSRTFRDKTSPTEVKDLAAKGVVQVACGA